LRLSGDDPVSQFAFTCDLYRYDEVVERFAVLEERLRIAEGCANEYCRERDMVGSCTS
jgi:hypothetical protein